MRSHRTTAVPSPPSDPVVKWRRSRLLDAGFSAVVATRLANDSGIDLHAVLDLIDRGCRPELAARILAPMDQNRGRS
jgi:hypothetical protein